MGKICYPHDPIVYAWMAHVVSLDLIPVRDKVSPHIYIDIFDKTGKLVASSNTENEAVMWTWSPLIFSKKAKIVRDKESVQEIYQNTLNETLNRIREKIEK